MNNLPRKIYLEKIDYGNRTQTKTTVSETTFNNWLAIDKLFRGALLPGLSVRYYIGTVDWEEVTSNDD